MESEIICPCISFHIQDRDDIMRSCQQIDEAQFQLHVKWGVMFCSCETPGKIVVFYVKQISNIRLPSSCQ